MNNTIKDLIHELTEMGLDLKKQIKTTPDMDMEKYENTEVEELVNGFYLQGKLDTIEELIEELKEQ